MQFRGSRPKVCSVASFNSIGKPQLIDAVGHLNQRTVAGSRASALLCQEHKLRGQGMTDAQHLFRKRGWDFRGSEGVVLTEDSAMLSAGVGTLVRVHVGSGAPLKKKHDISPLGGEG